jgi:hypothetical protein
MNVRHGPTIESELSALDPPPNKTDTTSPTLIFSQAWVRTAAGQILRAGTFEVMHTWSDAVAQLRSITLSPLDAVVVVPGGPCSIWSYLPLNAVNLPGIPSPPPPVVTDPRFSGASLYCEYWDALFLQRFAAPWLYNVGLLQFGFGFGTYSALDAAQLFSGTVTNPNVDIVTDRDYNFDGAHVGIVNGVATNTVYTPNLPANFTVLKLWDHGFPPYPFLTSGVFSLPGPSMVNLGMAVIEAPTVAGGNFFVLNVPPAGVVRSIFAKLKGIAYVGGHNTYASAVLYLPFWDPAVGNSLYMLWFHTEPGGAFNETYQCLPGRLVPKISQTTVSQVTVGPLHS